MSQFWVTGAAAVFAGTGAGGALQYLGFCEQGVTISLTSLHEDVHADYAGGVPVDLQYMGDVAEIETNLIKYDEVPYQKIISKLPNILGNPNQVPGVIPAGAIGSLMIQQQLAVRLLIYGVYTGAAAFPGMQSVYNFYAACPVGPLNVASSTRVKRPRIQWRAVPTWVLNTQTGYTTGTLYDNSVVGMPVFD